MLCGTRAWQGGPRVVGGGYKAPFGLSESPNEDANCPDRLCVSWGKINKPGETILCLPHRIIIRIIGEGGVDDVVS